MDPNSIIGTPREYEVWLAPDWGTFDESTKSPGATRVSVRETLYADGRRVTQVLDEKRQPITTRVLEQTIDKDQEKRFKDAQSTAQRQADQSERKKVSVTFEGSGKDRKRRTVYESGPDLVEDAPETASTDPNDPKNKNEAILQQQREKNAALPAELDPAYETDEERRKRSDARIKEQGVAAAAAETKARQTRIDEQSAATNAANARRAEAAEGRAAAEATAPIIATRQETINGVVYTVQTTTPKQGGTPTIKVFGPDGKEVPGGLPTDATKAPIPKGVPPYSPDLTKPGAGLIDRARQLDELVAAGTITWDQRNTVLEQDRVLASSIANEFNTGVAILREDYQNRASQRNADQATANTRATLANTHMQNALGLVEKFAPYLGQTPGDAGKLFTGMMAAQLATATAYGGMKDIPREQLSPGLTSWAERATAGATGTAPAATPAGAAAPPDAAPVAPPIETAPQSVTGPDGITRAPDGTPYVQGTMPPNGQMFPDPGWFTPKGMDRGSLPYDPVVDSAPQPAPLGPPVAQASPQIAALFGQTMPQPRAPEEDSWRQMAMNRRDLMLGQQYAGSALPEMPQPVGMDLNASTGPMPAPVLTTSIPGLTADIDRQARAELDQEWLS